MDAAVSQSYVDGLLKGPISRWTGEPCLYSARDLCETWRDIQFGIAISRIARDNSGFVPAAIIERFGEQSMRDAVNRIDVMRLKRQNMPIIDLMPVEVEQGRIIVFDANSLSLLVLAEEAFGQMFYRMQQQRGPRIEVGPILLKRFERAVEIFEMLLKLRVH